MFFLPINFISLINSSLEIEPWLLGWFFHYENDGTLCHEKNYYF